MELGADPHFEHSAILPTCPGWSFDDLLNHLGRVYAMVATALGDPAGNPPNRDLIPRRAAGQEPADWMRKRLELLMPMLREIPFDAVRWNFVGGPRSPVAFWWRRQAHETLIHRVDAELGARTPVGQSAREVAADGIAEFLFVSGFREVPDDDLDLGRGMTIHLHATDMPEAEWTIDTSAVSYARSHVKADITIRGPAWSLNRWVWRRGSAAPESDVATALRLPELEVFGNIRAAEEWRPPF